MSNAQFSPVYQSTEVQTPAVSYLTNPDYNPTIVVQHHHHGTALNSVLMAATGTVVTLFILFLAGMVFYLIRRRRRNQKKKLMKKNTDDKYSTGQLEMSRSIFSSEQDSDSFRHSKATCDTCSTRIHTTRPPISYTSTSHRQSQSNRISQYQLNTSPEQQIEDQSNQRRLSARILQSQLQTPILEQTLAEPFKVDCLDRKGNFDWDRCAFELQEEEAMWLPSPTAPRQALSRSRMEAHNRSCSESATLSPPLKSLLLPSGSFSNSKSRVTWSESPLLLESSDDYFDAQQIGGLSLVGLPGLSPGLMQSMTSAASSELSLLAPASPYVVHSSQRKSYSVQAEAQDWESHTDDIENLQTINRYRRTGSPKSPSASMHSSFSEATAFSDPFRGSKTDLNSDFVVLSRQLPVREKSFLPNVRDEDKKDPVRSKTSPIISSPLKEKSNKANAGDDEILDSMRASQGYRSQSANVNSRDKYPMETPLQTHRFSRRDAVVDANIPVSPR